MEGGNQHDTENIAHLHNLKYYHFEINKSMKD